MNRMPSSPAVTPASVVVAGDHQVSANLGEEVLVLSLASGKYHRLEGVAARIWSLIREPLPVGEVRNAIVAQYDVDADRCQSDLLELLEDLRERGLVEVLEGERTA